MRLIVLTTLTMIAFAANSILNRMALATDAIGPSDFAMIRIFAGAVVLSALVYVRARRVVDLGEVSVLSAASLTLYVLAFSFAYVTLPAGLGALVLFGGVQVTMFAGALMSGETMPRARWLGAMIAFVGLVFVLAPTDSAPPVGGVLLMSASAVGWGLYSLYGRRVRQPLQATAGNFLMAVPVALLVGWLVTDGVAMRVDGVLLAAASGAITSGLGYALWYAVLPELGASKAAVAQLTVPIIALAAGILMLGESMTLQFAIAAILVLGGVTLSIRN